MASQAESKIDCRMRTHGVVVTGDTKRYLKECAALPMGTLAEFKANCAAKSTELKLTGEGKSAMEKRCMNIAVYTAFDAQKIEADAACRQAANEQKLRGDAVTAFVNSCNKAFFDAANAAAKNAGYDLSTAFAASHAGAISPALGKLPPGLRSGLNSMPIGSKLLLEPSRGPLLRELMLTGLPPGGVGA